MARVVTNATRLRVAQWLNGGFVPPPEPAFVAFGDGGVDVQGRPLRAEKERTSLRAEFFRGAIQRKELAGDRVVVYTECDGNVVGARQVSEMGLFDITNTLIAYDTFFAQPVGPGTLIKFRFTFLFLDYRNSDED